MKIVTQDQAMRAIFRYVEAIANSPQPVLITGESGTGKELIANALHTLSGRPGELVALNVAGLDDSLFADTLFGHVRRSFTGAERARDGLVSGAAGGTLFLDEIGDLSLPSQVKLLRLLQDGFYYRVGSDKPLRSQARIIVSTNCDVLQDVKSGRFRKDLYFRLRTHHVDLPPLRARTGDIRLLLHHFVAIAAQSLGKPTPDVPADLARLLRGYSWPGNVREFEGMCFDAVARHQQGILSAQSFKTAMSQLLTAPGASVDTGPHIFWPTDALPTIDEAESALISEALQRVGGNQTVAAGMLGISRQALNKRLTRKKEFVDSKD